MRLVLACVMVSTTVHAAPAPGQPRMQPFVGAPGIALGGSVTSATFCDTARRAVLRLADGQLVALDADGAITQLGNPGTPVGAAMICDRKDQIWIAHGKTVAIVAPNQQPRKEPLAVENDIRMLRLLDDDTIGIIDQRSIVYRFGTVLERRWVAPSGRLPAALDGTGERALNVSAGRVEITSASGIVIGPAAVSAIWLDNTTVLLADRTGKVARWSISTPIEQARVIAQIPPRGTNVFVHGMFTPAGARRVIVSRGNEGPLLVLGFDAQGELAVSTRTSRVPVGRRSIAAGTSTFAVVSVNDRAYIAADLTKPAFLVDREHALAGIDALAFAPDGRSLAFLGGDGDVLVAPLDHRTKPYRLEATVPFVRGPLRWFADGTLTAGNFGIHMRWNPDGTFEDRRVRSLGFTERAHPITFDNRTMRIAIDLGHSEQIFPVPRDLFVSRADVHGNLLVLRGSGRIEVHDLTAPFGTPARIRTQDRPFLREAVLVGEPRAPAVMYIDDKNNLRLSDGKATDRQLDTFAAGVPIVAVAADGKRVAIANLNTLTLFDDRGRLVDKLTVRGDVTAIAWSPDLHTLAVASRDGIDLWTFPR